VSTARMSAKTAAAVCVAMSRRRLSTLSASAPAQAPRTSTGPNCRPTVMPRAMPLPVSCSTSQLCATDCIQVPLIETTWEMKNRR
jgi:hypothetical protein